MPFFIMKEHPKISIITPSFNQGQFLEKTIQSVIGQNYPNLEYIIIDGGSTDNSVEIIERHQKQLTYWVSEKDRGQPHAFNKGLQYATSEIIGWINSDDIYLNRCLFEATEYLKSHQNVDIVFSDYIYIDEKGRYLKRRKEIPFNYSVYLWLGDCFHANCAGFFRRKVFESIGGLDESLQYSMDYEFYLRAASSGMKISHFRSYWAAYRLHGQSKSVFKSHMQRDEGQNIAAQFRPIGISNRNVWYRRNAVSLVRYFCKFFLGSYFPSFHFKKNELIT